MNPVPVNKLSKKKEESANSQYEHIKVSLKHAGRETTGGKWETNKKFEFLNTEGCNKRIEIIIFEMTAQKN